MYSISYRAEKRLSVTERTVRMDVGPEDTHHSYLCQSNGHLYFANGKEDRIVSRSGPRTLHRRVVVRAGIEFASIKFSIRQSQPR